MIKQLKFKYNSSQYYGEEWIVVHWTNVSNTFSLALNS